MLGVVRKAAEEQLDYDVDFERWLSDGDTVQSAEVEPIEGLQVVSVQVFGAVVKVWLAGGELFQTYTVKVTATSAEGRVKEECFKVRVTGC